MLNIMYILFLGAALSLDALVTGVAYGIKKIQLPWFSLLVIGAITFLCTTFAMFSARIIGTSIDTHITTVLGALIMIILGLWNIFVEYMTLDSYITQRKLKISVGKLVIKIMANPEKADLDLSKDIGPTEAIFLGLALGVDNIVAIFAACLAGTISNDTPIILAIIQMAFIYVGLNTSRYLVSDGIRQRAPYLSGIVLLLLGIIRL